MIFWHLGMTVMIVRYVYRDPAMDLRWVLAGSILPDLIDKPLGSVFFHDTFQTHRLFSHSVLFPILGLLVVLVMTSRGSTMRKNLIGLVIGALIHLVLDAAWADAEAFWWPLFGLEFPHVAGSDLPRLVGSMLRNPWVWAGEAVGFGYLVWLWRTRVRTEGGIRAFIKDGRISMSGA